MELITICCVHQLDPVSLCFDLKCSHWMVLIIVLLIQRPTWENTSHPNGLMVSFNHLFDMFDFVDVRSQLLSQLARVHAAASSGVPLIQASFDGFSVIVMESARV